MSKKRVVGVSYEVGDSAPYVVLKAAGQDAEVLLAQARRDTDTPIVPDPQLVNQLYKVPLDSPIGAELFPVMAALLVHVLHVDQRTRENPK